jgi:hypothetical protein
MACNTNGTKFYTIEGVDKTDAPTKLYLKEYTDSVLEAGVPYIFISSANKVYFHLGGTYVSTPASANGLIGCYSITAVPANAYSFVRGELCSSDGKAALNSYEAYVDMSKLSAVTSGDATVTLKTATGIKGISSSLTTGNSALYNVSGQRVNSSYRGLVIKDGKKSIQMK